MEADPSCLRALVARRRRREMTHRDTRADSPVRSKRALDRVFGDVLPDTTRDERLTGSDADQGDDGASGVTTSRRRDEELLREVPPHHG